MSSRHDQEGLVTGAKGAASAGHDGVSERSPRAIRRSGVSTDKGGDNTKVPLTSPRAPAPIVHIAHRSSVSTTAVLTLPLI